MYMVLIPTCLYIHFIAREFICALRVVIFFVFVVGFLAFILRDHYHRNRISF